MLLQGAGCLGRLLGGAKDKNDEEVADGNSDKDDTLLNKILLVSFAGCRAWNCLEILLDDFGPRSSETLSCTRSTSKSHTSRSMYPLGPKGSGQESAECQKGTKQSADLPSVSVSPCTSVPSNAHHAVQRPRPKSKCKNAGQFQSCVPLHWTTAKHPTRIQKSIAPRSLRLLQC